jgi:hypothetical protein
MMRPNRGRAIHCAQCALFCPVVQIQAKPLPGKALEREHRRWPQIPKVTGAATCNFEKLLQFYLNRPV